MMIQGLLLPVFVLVALSFATLFWRGRSRGLLARNDAVADGLGPALQLDLLFYVVVALALPLRHADLVMVLLAWVFVLTRVLAAGVLVSGAARNERLAGLASALVLLAMWVYFALRIVTVL
jgi:hypothetical protein